VQFFAGVFFCFEDCVLLPSLFLRGAIKIFDFQKPTVVRLVLCNKYVGKITKLWRDDVGGRECGIEGGCGK